MVDREKEIFLSELNNEIEEFYAQNVRRKVAKKRKPVDEIAIIRKLLYCVIHGEKPSNELIKEFDEYYNDVEKIKSEIKDDLGITR